MTLKYADLTPTEKRFVCNGCGAKGRGAWVPDFMFTASCDHHDFNYWRGGNEAAREKADREFYEAMKRDVRRLSWYRRPLARFLAWRYYRAVRRWGRSAFFYGQPKGIAELEKEMSL